MATSLIFHTFTRTSMVLRRTLGKRSEISVGKHLARFTTSSSLLAEKYRKVHERIVGDTLEIEATYEETGPNYTPVADPHGACPICSRNLQITYKDVLILNQFVDKEGKLLPRDLTGVCAKQQLHLRECVERALAADLLPNHRPSHLPKPQEKQQGKATFHRF